jgi:hypothetical protein
VREHLGADLVVPARERRSGPVLERAAQLAWSWSRRSCLFSSSFSDFAWKKPASQPYASWNGRATRSAPTWKGRRALAATPWTSWSLPLSDSRKYPVISASERPMRTPATIRRRNARALAERDEEYVGVAAR